MIIGVFGLGVCAGMGWMALIYFGAGLLTGARFGSAPAKKVVAPMWSADDAR